MDEPPIDFKEHSLRTPCAPFCQDNYSPHYTVFDDLWREWPAGQYKGQSRSR